ncbi:MAG: hypothetical protein Kow0069_39090 [Promethearchaeota archaeon]
MSIDDYFKKIRDRFFRDPFFGGLDFDAAFRDFFRGMFPPRAGVDGEPDEREFEEAPFEVESKDDPRSNFRSFGIEYRFGTGMDAPEVRTWGNLPPEEMDEMARRWLEANSGRIPLPAGTGGQVASLPEGERTGRTGRGRSGPVEPFSETYYDEDGGFHAVLEVPGVGGDEVEVSAKGKELRVVAKNPHRRYEKTFNLPFAPARTSISFSVTNGVLEVFAPKPPRGRKDGDKGTEKERGKGNEEGKGTD